MKKQNHELGLVSYESGEENSLSLKHELVAAVANGDEDEADKLRLLLKGYISEYRHPATLD